MHALKIIELKRLLDNISYTDIDDNTPVLIKDSVEGVELIVGPMPKTQEMLHIYIK